MTLPSNFANVIIDGNTIDHNSTFSYSNLLNTSADCRITNNYFSGIQNSTSNTWILNLNSGTCNIQNNTFLRGSSSITNYIKSDGYADQIIIGNIFDGYTSDGSNTDLITNLSVSSIYTSNKNQVGYAIIPLGTEKPTVQHINSPISNAHSVFNSTDGASSFTSDVVVTSGFLYDMMVLQIFDTDGVSSHFTTSVDISKSVPIGAKIIDVKATIYNPSGGAGTPITLTAGNSLGLSLSSSRNHTDSLNIGTHISTGTNNWDLLYTSSAAFVTVTGSELFPTPITLEIPTMNYTGPVVNNGSASSVTNNDISINYIVNSNTNIIANLAFTYTASSAAVGAGTPLFLISPIVVTYVF